MYKNKKAGHPNNAYSSRDSIKKNKKVSNIKNYVRKFRRCQKYAQISTVSFKLVRLSVVRKRIIFLRL